LQEGEWRSLAAIPHHVSPRMVEMTMPHFNVTMTKYRTTSAIIEAKTGKEAKEIALERPEELFDFDLVLDEDCYDVGEAEFIPPDKLDN
jgi:hypothetical protein